MKVVVTLFIGVVLGLLTIKNITAQVQRRPNIVVIIADDLGYGNIGTFGAPNIRASRLDAMATEGQKWTSFYVQPVCSPSRAALPTGRLPVRNGMFGKSSNVPLTIAPHQEVYRRGGAIHQREQGPAVLPVCSAFAAPCSAGKIRRFGGSLAVVPRRDVTLVWSTGAARFRRGWAWEPRDVWSQHRSYHRPPAANARRVAVRGDRADQMGRPLKNPCVRTDAYLQGLVPAAGAASAATSESRGCSLPVLKCTGPRYSGDRCAARPRWLEPTMPG